MSKRLSSLCTTAALVIVLAWLWSEWRLRRERARVHLYVQAIREGRYAPEK